MRVPVKALHNLSGSGNEGLLQWTLSGATVAETATDTAPAATEVIILAVTQEAAINQPAPSSRSAPKSFGSANSNAERQSYYALSQGDQQAPPDTPNTSMRRVSTDAEVGNLTKELKRVTASNEELCLTVRELRVANSQFEERVIELEAKFLHQENVSHAEHHIGTPRTNCILIGQHHLTGAFMMTNQLSLREYLNHQ